MKTKSIILLGLLALISCSKDEQEPNPALTPYLGEWRGKIHVYTVNEIGQSGFYSNNTLPIFRSIDGSTTCQEIINGVNSECTTKFTFFESSVYSCKTQFHLIDTAIDENQRVVIRDLTLSGDMFRQGSSLADTGLITGTCVYTNGEIGIINWGVYKATFEPVLK